MPIRPGTRTNGGATEVTDPNSIPHYIKELLAQDDSKCQGFVCGKCVKKFTITAKAGTCCAICGGGIARDKKNSTTVSTVASLPHWCLRRFGAKGDLAHKACVTKLGDIEKEPAESNVVIKDWLRVSVDVNSRDKTKPLEPDQERLLSFLLSCKRAQNQTSFKCAPYRSDKKGSTLSVQIVPVVTGKSKSSQKRKAKAIVDTAKTVSSNSATESAATVIEYAALHSKEGKKAKLLSRDKQGVVNLEKVQSAIRASGSKTKKIARVLKQENIAYNLSLNSLQKRKVGRRLDMIYDKGMVIHDESGNSQTVYTKRSRDMCNIVAQRMAILFQSSHFEELDGVPLGGAKAIYWSLVVRLLCVLFLVFSFSFLFFYNKIQNHNHNHPPHTVRCWRRFLQDSTSAKERKNTFQYKLGYDHRPHAQRFRFKGQA